MSTEFSSQGKKSHILLEKGPSTVQYSRQDIYFSALTEWDFFTQVVKGGLI